MFKVLKGQDERPVEYVDSSKKKEEKTEDWYTYLNNLF
jgi:hypothetical protein